jgi:hypothetical protein
MKRRDFITCVVLLGCAAVPEESTVSISQRVSVCLRGRVRARG